MKKIIPLLLIAVFQNYFLAQTGPGGVGNATTLALWLDAEDISLSNGSSVSSWSDKSGNGNDFTAPVGLSQHLFRLLILIVCLD